MQIKIWEARQYTGLSLEQLAQLSQISKTTLFRIENGRVSPRLDQLEKIAQATGIAIIDLFESPYKTS